MLLLYIYDYEICQYIYFFKTGKKNLWGYTKYYKTVENKF